MGVTIHNIGHCVCLGHLLAQRPVGMWLGWGVCVREIGVEWGECWCVKGY